MSTNNESDKGLSEISRDIFCEADGILEEIPRKGSETTNIQPTQTKRGKLDTDTSKDDKNASKTSAKVSKRIADSGVFKTNPYLAQVVRFYDKQPFFYDHAKLFWFWDFTSNKWMMVDEVDLMNSLDKSVTAMHDTIAPAVRNMYLESFKRLGRLMLPDQAPNTWVQFKDVLIDIKADTEAKATNLFFVTNPLPWNYVKDKETPIMDQLMTQWVGKDNVKQLKQIIAYCMVPNYFIHRIFCFIGAGSNGKSTFLDLLRKFLGEDNYCSTELDDLMTGRFEQAKLYKKLACMMGETNFNTMSRTSKLKKLSGGDLVSIEYKNKNAFDTVNYAKLIISTNGLPSTKDQSYGFYRRWMIIDFPNQFKEKADVLGRIPDSEYEALTGQCVELLKDLWVNPCFHNEGSVEDRARKYEEMSDPLQMFIKSECEEDLNSYVFKWDLRSRLKVFCERKGYRSMSDDEVGKLMKDKGYETKKKPHISDSGDNKYHWAYLGLSFNDDAPIKTSLREDILKEFQDGERGFLFLIEKFGDEKQVSKVLGSLCNDGLIFEVRPSVWRRN